MLEKFRMVVRWWQVSSSSFLQTRCGMLSLFALFKISHIRFDFAATAKISMASLIGNTWEPCGIVSANKLYLANYLVLFTLG